MKIGEGLLLRADLQKRLERVKERFTQNAKIQEGDKPSEDPKDLFTELDTILNELTSLIQRINKTNTSVIIEKSFTLSDYLTQREMIKRKHEILIEFSNAAAVKTDRYSRSEVKFRATFNIADIQKQADDLAKEIRTIDTRIQEANWANELAG